MVDVSGLFDLLQADARRQLLVTLCDVDSIDVSEGIRTRSAASSRPTATAPREPVGPGDGTPTAEKLRLYHTHLPKLESHGVVEWDRENDIVTRGPAFDDVAPSVRLLATNAGALPGSFF
jgi:hypothetical protein